MGREATVGDARGLTVADRPTPVIHRPEIPSWLQSFAFGLTSQAANGLLCVCGRKEGAVLLDIFVAFVCYTTFPLSNY
jgi:hypothetical protein